MGNEQDRRKVDMDASSPTVSSTAVYTVADIAVVERRHILTLDIGGIAYMEHYIYLMHILLLPGRIFWSD